MKHHDDSRELPDSTPQLTYGMQPSAFTKELVGSYDAFEEIDLPSYLGVRAQTTETAAVRAPYSAVPISMHTVNLLTVQADLSTLTKKESKMHSAFIEGLLARQAELKKQVRAMPDLAAHATEKAFAAGFLLFTDQ